MTNFKSCKCPNCGANLKFKDGDEKATCTHCNSDILIEKDMDQELKKTIVNKMKNDEKNGKRAVIVFIVVFICFVCGGVVINRVIDSKNSVTEFNFQFSLREGSKEVFFVKQTLDTVISSNRKNKDHLITVVYNDIKTTNVEEISSIKNMLQDSTFTPKYYNIFFDYDNDGYINTMTITE